MKTSRKLIIFIAAMLSAQWCHTLENILELAEEVAVPEEVTPDDISYIEAEQERKEKLSLLMSEIINSVANQVAQQRQNLNTALQSQLASITSELSALNSLKTNYPAEYAPIKNLAPALQNLAQVLQVSYAPIIPDIAMATAFKNSADFNQLVTLSATNLDIRTILNQQLQMRQYPTNIQAFYIKVNAENTQAQAAIQKAETAVTAARTGKAS